MTNTDILVNHTGIKRICTVITLSSALSNCTKMSFKMLKRHKIQKSSQFLVVQCNQNITTRFATDSCLYADMTAICFKSV